MEDGFSWSADVKQVPVYHFYIRERHALDKSKFGSFASRVNAETTLSVLKELTEEERHTCFGRDVDLDDLRIVEDKAYNPDGTAKYDFVVISDKE